MLSITSHISHDILMGKKITAHKIHPRTWDEDSDYASIEEEMERTKKKQKTLIYLILNNSTEP